MFHGFMMANKMDVLLGDDDKKMMMMIMMLKDVSYVNVLGTTRYD